MKAHQTAYLGYKNLDINDYAYIVSYLTSSDGFTTYVPPLIASSQILTVLRISRMGDWDIWGTKSIWSQAVFCVIYAMNSRLCTATTRNVCVINHIATCANVLKFLCDDNSSANQQVCLSGIYNDISKVDILALWYVRGLSPIMKCYFVWTEWKRLKLQMVLYSQDLIDYALPVSNLQIYAETGVLQGI